MLSTNRSKNILQINILKGYDQLLISPSSSWMIPVAVSLVDEARGLLSLADSLKLSSPSGMASLVMTTEKLCVEDGWELVWNTN